MLKEFHTAHCKIWAIKPPPKSFESKLDSLQKIYCTQKLRKKATEYLSDQGFDLFTDDWGIDVESLKNMTIIKESTKENAFIISYTIIAYPQSLNKPVKEYVILHLTLIKENGRLKIASVKDSTTRLT
jgi:hypothetical protein